MFYSQVYFLITLRELVKLKPALSDDDISRILSDVQELLEKTENGSIMTAIVEIASLISIWRPKLFEEYFQVFKL